MPLAYDFWFLIYNCVWHSTAHFHAVLSDAVGWATGHLACKILFGDLWRIYLNLEWLLENRHSGPVKQKTDSNTHSNSYVEEDIQLICQLWFSMRLCFRLWQYGIGPPSLKRRWALQSCLLVYLIRLAQFSWLIVRPSIDQVKSSSL